MSIGGASVPIGEVTLYVRPGAANDTSQAELNIHSDSDDDRLGGVALNCLHVDDVPAEGGIFGKNFSFGQSEDQSGVELGESVFWKPGGDTLEVDSVRVTLGEPRGDLLPLEIDAICRDIETGGGLAVSIRGMARLG